MAIKCIILIGGPNKGQRFRPLSFDSPKCMFPVGGQIIVGHLIESCLKLTGISEIILLGFYQQSEMFSLKRMVHKLIKSNPKLPNPSFRYLQEYTRMGTAGGLYHFRDQIRHGNPDAFLLINGDVCGDFDFEGMLMMHRKTTEQAEKSCTSKPLMTVMTTKASKQESLNYGCIVENPLTSEIEHYVEKPSTFVSDLINCGAYLCSLELLDFLEETKRKRRHEFSNMTGDIFNYPTDLHPDYLSLELDILQQTTSQSRCYSYRAQGTWWCQIKTAASAIYANRQYLEQYRKHEGNCQLATERDDRNKECKIHGNVYIHPSAVVSPTCEIGPNVSIMRNCVIGPGVRIKESIILQDANVMPHALVLCSIVGWNCYIGPWARIEGTLSEPDPNQKFARVKNPPLFNQDGKLTPSISVLGSNVKVPLGTVMLNSIVLPHKELSRSYKNEIVL